MKKACLFIGILLFLKCFIVRCHLVLSICPVGKMIVSQENKDLNLTCKVTSEERSNNQFDLSWKLPIKSNRVSIYEIDNELTITIHMLQEDDSGQYICELNNKGIIRTKKVSVYVKSKKCFKPFFDCGNGLCIPKHYVCDGYIDCPSGYDESFKHCGPDACHGKFLCDGRCIPKELCCDPNIDINCTVNYIMPCCHKILSPTIDLDPSQCIASVECRYGQIFGFGHSMLYIVASCAIVVMLVSSIFMILVCRICSRNTEDFQAWPRASSRHHQCPINVDGTLDPLNNEDFLPDDSINYLTHSMSNNDREQSEDFVLLNFVPGYGFEVAECRPKPPPYSENAIGIPPPPYASMLDVSNGNTAALLETTDQAVSNEANS